MKKLFIHNLLFRFLSPVFSGTVGYLLILLINNNVVQLQEEFLGKELYVCIGLSYLIQEFSRLLLFAFKLLPSFASTIIMLLIQIVTSMLLSIGIITLSIITYYKNVENFTPSNEDLVLFNSIFCSITLIYILLYISHQYLYKVNTQKLNHELLIKQNIEEDFKQFKREINPNLLFESLEILLVLIKEDKNKVDEFIDHLSTIYRYILASKKDQLVSIHQEVNVLNEFIQLYNHLPYRKVLVNNNSQNFLIVPGTLLFIIEQVIRRTIVSKKMNLVIDIEECEHFFEIKYNPEDKIVDEFSERDISEIERVYSIYSMESCTVIEENNHRIISIPKLQIKS